MVFFKYCVFRRFKIYSGLCYLSVCVLLVCMRHFPLCLYARWQVGHPQIRQKKSYKFTTVYGKNKVFNENPAHQLRRIFPVAKMKCFEDYASFPRMSQLEVVSTRWTHVMIQAILPVAPRDSACVLNDINVVRPHTARSLYGWNELCARMVLGWHLSLLLYFIRMLFVIFELYIYIHKDDI